LAHSLNRPTQPTGQPTPLPPLSPREHGPAQPTQHWPSPALSPSLPRASARATRPTNCRPNPPSPPAPRPFTFPRQLTSRSHPSAFPSSPRAPPGSLRTRALCLASPLASAPRQGALTAAPLSLFPFRHDPACSRHRSAASACLRFVTWERNHRVSRVGHQPAPPRP
jgi:hypothetical protein